MAVPIAAAASTAAKFLAKQVAQRAAAGAISKATGGGNEDPDKPKLGLALTVTAVVLVVLLVFSLVNGAIVGVMSMIPDPSRVGTECYTVPDVDPTGKIVETITSGSSSADAGSGSGSLLTDVPEASGEVVYPLEIKPGHRITSSYGPRVPPVPGAYPFHYGTDFSNSDPYNTAIFAAADGVVWKAVLESGSGNVVYIQHNIGGVSYISRYAHMSSAYNAYVQTGDTVTAGQRIGTMGSTGTFTTGPHLHFEVWQNGTSIQSAINSLQWLEGNGAVNIANPLPGSPLDGGGGTTPIMVEYCFNGNGSMESNGNNSGVGSGPWGGHENGKIPASALCGLDFASGHLLRCDAASALNALNVSYRERFGHDMVVTDSYRSYEGQVQCRAQKGSLCATPGTSNHGWGLAVDLGDGVDSFLSAQYKWMSANASKHGWVNPSWARQGGSKPEPWHWEYTGGGAAVVGPDAGKTPESARLLAQEMMREYGWSNDQFQCLNNLWNRESGWNYKAANPTSSARGIAQTMMSAHFGSAWQLSPDAMDFLNSPARQIEWGLNYIRDRYSNPCGAWAHSERTGWY